MADGNGPHWAVTIGSALLALIGSYFTANYAATSAVDVAKTQANSAIQAAKEAAKAEVDAAKAANRVDMAKLALTLVNDKTTPDNLRNWALQVLAACTDVPLSPDEGNDIAKEFKSIIQANPNAKMAWDSMADPKVNAIFKGLKDNYSTVWTDAFKYSAQQ
ncbi:hypothetical protein [Mesorhizobium sp. M1E.F.Ca.ET.041.01.1.1]|uniref:hypothetical protein n=1 Tax=Mesorhizobium sp. M1E.F.Ca.ET.041.01.1.1 TaxID=2496759 RepID=UPI000FCA2084|nr:hypothetical protein [Mesorhizobium sp. M1E.F.Ca.ET.041.01.1.1]RUW31005.1 hypothetical protein EOA38_19000 [Mesorhizobium sp. M1E.F.Ca.ET.041.01.1.1]RWD92678.1 MAG: hypothetical protein EOS38_02295 [Mesorhizobium sp.]